MIVATAGHIDHGKTTLVRALTGVDTDRLPEEKARGISIDLGFAYWKTPQDNLTIGFVDVPGHERFVRNMLAGVCGIDFVLFVVAADDGVMPQTVEHLNIVELLSVTRGLAVITKADRATPERLAEVAAAVKSLLAPTGLAGIEVLPVSATTGEGMDALREALAAATRASVREGQRGRQFRYAIDRAFSVPGSGTVVTGTVFNGAVAPGDKLLISPAGIEVRVRGLQKDGKPATGAVAGERCALNLTGVEVAQVQRGDWVVAPALQAPTQRLDAQLHVLSSETHAVKHWTPVHLHLGAGDVTARISIRRGGSIAPGESGPVRLITDKPVSALNGDRFIVRDQSALRTIGGGTVVDPTPKPQRCRAEVRTLQLEALTKSDPAEALAALQACTPAGVDLAWFGRVFNFDESFLSGLVQRGGLVVIGKDPQVCLPKELVAAVKVQVLAELARFHAASPQALGMEMVALRKLCAPHLAAATFAALLRALVDDRKAEVSGSVARLPRHVATDNPADAVMWDRVQPALHAGGFNGLTLAELAAAAAIREPQLKDFLHRKSKTGEVVKVTADRFYWRGTLARFAAITVKVAHGLPDGKFSAAQVRDHTDIGRTRAILILECFDRLGLTRRIGDVRVIHKDYVPVFGPAPGS